MPTQGIVLLGNPAQSRALAICKFPHRRYECGLHEWTPNTLSGTKQAREAVQRKNELHCAMCYCKSAAQRLSNKFSLPSINATAKGQTFAQPFIQLSAA